MTVRYSLRPSIGGVFWCDAMTKERQRMQDSSLISRFHLLCMQLLSYYQAITLLNL